MNTNVKRILTILILLAVAFIIVSFALPFDKGIVFFISLIFGVAAFALQIPVFKKAYEKADTLRSKLLGFPVFRVGYLYLGIQVTLSIALYALGTFMKTFPVWLAVVLCVMVLIGFGVCVISADMSRDYVTNIEQTTAVNTKLIKDLALRANMLTNSVSENEKKTALEKLAEAFRYSDPVSSPELSDVENELSVCFSTLENEASNSSAERVAQLCSEVQRVLEKRNMACKSFK